MQCRVCSAQCAVYSVECAVCNVQCTVCSVECRVCSVQCAVCSVVCSVQCTFYSVQCAVYSVQFTHIAEPISGNFHSYCNNIAYVRQAGMMKRLFYRCGLCGGKQQWDRLIRAIRFCPLSIILPNLHIHLSMPVIIYLW